MPEKATRRSRHYLNYDKRLLAKVVVPPFSVIPEWEFKNWVRRNLRGIQNSLPLDLPLDNNDIGVQICRHKFCELCSFLAVSPINQNMKQPLSRRINASKQDDNYPPELSAQFGARFGHLTDQLVDKLGQVPPSWRKR